MTAFARGKQASLLLLALAVVGCGPSVRDLAARHRWREAIDHASSIEDYDTVTDALRERTHVRIVARVYTEAELAELLGWVPEQLRAGGSFVLFAYRAEGTSDDFPITSVVVSPEGSELAFDSPCCTSDEDWSHLYFQQPDGGSSWGEWSAQAEVFGAILATAGQTIVGTLRDGATLATAGAVAPTPVEGRGVDLSIGALLSRLGAPRSSTTPASDDTAAREAEARARLHAILAAECGPADGSCTHYALYRVGTVTGLSITWRYGVGPGETYLSGDARLSLTEHGGAPYLRELFAGGLRDVAELGATEP